MGIYKASTHFQNYLVEKGVFLEQKGSISLPFPTIKICQLAAPGPLSISPPPSAEGYGQIPPCPPPPAQPPPVQALPLITAFSGFSTLQHASC